MPEYRLTYPESCYVQPIKALFSLSGVVYKYREVNELAWDNIKSGNNQTFTISIDHLSFINETKL